jgi:tetratricopeptide (TPR) repeat protein
MSGVRTRTTVRAVIALAAFLVSLLYARHVLGTTFRTYDDEGYFLLSLDHYLRGGALYTDVFSHYGPFHFFAQEALFRLLRLPVNHDAGRLVTLIWWLLSAVLGGYFVYSLSNNMALASAATLACAKLASLLANEPGHPQQVILPILMLACCASVAPRGRYDGALAEARAALDLDDRYYGAHLVIAESYFFQGRPTEAREPAEEAFRLAPWDPVAAGFLAGASNPIR